MVNIVNEKTIYNWRDFEDVVCPKCGTKNVAKILFGRPIWCDELKEKIDSGEIVLGGCIVDKEYPVYECNQCQERWGRQYDDEDFKQFYDMIEKTSQDNSEHKNRQYDV